MEFEYLIGDILAGSLVGYSVGYFAHKFFKLVAVIFGGYTASLMYLNSRGFITVNWDVFAASTDGILSKIGGWGLSVGVLGTGAIAGFLVGWRSS